MEKGRGSSKRWEKKVQTGDGACRFGTPRAQQKWKTVVHRKQRIELKVATAQMIELTAWEQSRTALDIVKAY